MKNFNVRSVKLWSLITVEVLKRNKIGISAGVIFILLFIFVQAQFNIFYHPNSITLGFIGTYQEHDLPTEVTKLVSQPLVKTDSSGVVKGNLVSGWETNNDATDFKFKLKDNLKWADGSAIKSGDLVFSIPNVEISTPDDKTIEFKLKESYSPLPSLLTRPIIKKGSMMGTGPYEIKKIEKSRVFITKIELKALDKNLPDVSVRFYPTEKVAITGFNLGEVQVLFGLSKLAPFSNNPKVGHSQKTDYSKIVSVLFQTEDPLLSLRSLRQALSYITPIIKEEEKADNPYPPTLWAYDKNSKIYLNNADDAKAALKRAESQMDAGKMHSEIILTSTPNLEEVGKSVVNAWKSLGFDAKLRVESGIPQNFQSLLITQSIPTDPDQYFLWHATQKKTNLTKYNSKRADKDLEDGRKIITQEDRKTKYFDFQKTLLEDAPAIFLYFPKYNIVYLKKKEDLLNKVLKLEN